VLAQSAREGEDEEVKLYEILVPTIYGDTNKPIRTRHHKKWDERVKKLAGGLTILSPGKGVWVHEGKDYLEKVIPVRIMCEEKTMKSIVDITLQHYRQISVMYYVVSDECHIVFAKEKEPSNGVQL
jgi:hypothetical protein